mgnify:CR=1 FL=1
MEETSNSFWKCLEGHCALKRALRGPSVAASCWQCQGFGINSHNQLCVSDSGLFKSSAQLSLRSPSLSPLHPHRQISHSSFQHICNDLISTTFFISSSFKVNTSLRSSFFSRGYTVSTLQSTTSSDSEAIFSFLYSYILHTLYSTHIFYIASIYSDIQRVLYSTHLSSHFCRAVLILIPFYAHTPAFSYSPSLLFTPVSGHYPTPLLYSATSFKIASKHLSKH